MVTGGYLIASPVVGGIVFLSGLGGAAFSYYMGHESWQEYSDLTAECRGCRGLASLVNRSDGRLNPA